MAACYAGFAVGGFSLVITDGIYTDDAHAQGYLFQPGLANDAQRDAWRSMVERVHATGGRIVAPMEDFDRALLAPIADLANADRLADSAHPV